MLLQERAYSTLVVSSAAKFNSAVTSLLSEADCCPVNFAASIAAAKRAVAERKYDFIIINTPLSDDFGEDFAVDICGEKESVALLIIKADVYAEINGKVMNQGVFTLPKPTSAQMLSQALKWMTAARERLRRIEKKNSSMEEKMEEIRLVNRAKWLLIENLSMTEADAHRYIEKQAMDRCVTKRSVAESIIRTYK